MWIFRRRTEIEVETLRAKLSAAEQRIASQNTTIDWLTMHVNSLEMQRAQLTERFLGVVYPVPTIERAGEVPAGRKGEIVGRPVAEFQVPEHLRESMAAASKLPRMAPATPPRPMGPPDDYAASMAAHMANPDLFNDPGDDAAAAAGIGHDNCGNVTYREG